MLIRFFIYVFLSPKGCTDIFILSGLNQGLRSLGFNINGIARTLKKLRTSKGDYWRM